MMQPHLHPPMTSEQIGAEVIRLLAKLLARKVREQRAKKESAT